MACEDRGRICFAFVLRKCGWQKSKYPQFEPMADDAITQGGIRGLGSPLYICGCYLSQNGALWEGVKFDPLPSGKKRKIKDNSKGKKSN